MFEPQRLPSVRSPRSASALVVLAVLVAVLPDCGGPTPTAPPPTTTTTVPPATLPPTPTTLGDLSASVTSPQAEASINCTDEVHARITVVNNGATDVAIRGILDRTGTISGRCFGDSDFTFTGRTPIARAKATTVVLDQSLYQGGPGCCAGSGCGSSCRFQEGFEVLTDLGNVPAGAFSYFVFFQNCPSCARATATGNAACVAMKGSGTAATRSDRSSSAPAPQR